MRRRLVALALLPALAGCGGGGGPSDVLSQTAKNLGKIRSGTLSVRLVLTPRRGGRSRPFGFRLHGPFALGRPGSVPRLRLAYTQIANGRQATVTLVSTGAGAYVLTNGRTASLPASGLASLRGLGGASNSAGGLSGLHVGTWLKKVRKTACTGGGSGLECVKGDLDLVRATNDLLALAGASTGRALPQLHGAGAEQLRKSVSSATVYLATGRRDRLLRSLVVDVRFGLEVPRELRYALGSIAGAHVVFELEVQHPNAR